MKTRCASQPGNLLGVDEGIMGRERAGHAARGQVLRRKGTAAPPPGPPDLWAGRARALTWRWRLPLLGCPVRPQQESPGCPCSELPGHAPVGDRGHKLHARGGGDSSAHGGGPGHAARTHQPRLQPTRPQPCEPVEQPLSPPSRGAGAGLSLSPWPVPTEKCQDRGLQREASRREGSQRPVRTPDDRLAPVGGVLPGGAPGARARRRAVGRHGWGASGATPCAAASLQPAGDEPPPPTSGSARRERPDGRPPAVGGRLPEECVGGSEAAGVGPLSGAGGPESPEIPMDHCLPTR